MSNSDPIAGKDDLGLHSARLIDLAWKALNDVCDPELCIDVVTLGLVYGVNFDGTKIAVEMTLTTQGCPAAEFLPSIAESAIVQAIDGEVPVEINIVWDPPWDPSFMKPIENEGTRINIFSNG